MKKKLIEVALPLEAINAASAREKSIRHGHPSTLHLWWARRPLAACRAVLFSSLIDDPSAHPEKFVTDEAQDAERQRLFRLIEELVKWESSTDERVLKAARQEIRKSIGGSLPSILDPFCGGGSIPLEAQRLGLEAQASDLNPVAVLITKALIEIPPKFSGKPSVNPASRKKLDHARTWVAAQGLAEDVRYYGQWMQDEAKKRIGELYPRVTLTVDMGGGEATAIAWIWARTVASPNPAAKGTHVPLVRSFSLCTKPGKQVWVEPVVDSKSLTYRFEVRSGQGEPRSGTVNRNGAVCLLTGSPIPLSYVREEGQAHRMGARLMAIVAEGAHRRLYTAGTEVQERVASCEFPNSVPDTDLPKEALGFRVQNYGMKKHRDLFTNRQLTALTTFAQLVGEARERVMEDGGGGEYADAVATYLAFALSKGANYWSSICTWHQAAEKLVSTFGLPVLPMTWDYTEANPFSDSSGNWMLGIEQAYKAILTVPASVPGKAVQADAASLPRAGDTRLVSTDPPYYDNVPYADLSDFFYIWLRKCLGRIYPDLLSTILVPKERELIAEPFRHGGKVAAQKFFEHGLKDVFDCVRSMNAGEYPFTVFYAFKQQETEADNEEPTAGTASTGWESMLEALIASGFLVSGTWPMRTEQSGGLRESGRNSLASSIVLVCRPRAESAPIASRAELASSLRSELPIALKKLQQGNVAPVDLAQAAIGPGMAIFSRYSKVVEAEGTKMSVRIALSMINRVLDEVLAEQEGDFDACTRWAVAWFEHSGFDEGDYGIAETLSKAKNTSISVMKEAGILSSGRGKVRLLRPSELGPEWDPASDPDLIVWTTVHQLIRALEGVGEKGAAAFVAKLGSKADIARELSYRLYSICERKKRAQEALSYNALVQSWPEIVRLAREAKTTVERQANIFQQR